jgi:lipopolysaccharide transport system ATP-binding protein
MSDAVIRVENLSKKYTLSHQQQGQKPTSLRELMSEGAQAIGDRLRGRGPVEDATREDFWALKDVGFEISQGDRVGIIGRNGAGKSTLLKILSRIVEPTTGEIAIRGRVASLLEVGTGFHPELTGRENIFLNGAILGMRKAEIVRKFDEIVAFAEVEKFLDTPVKRYSSGMYVRLAFAVAAHLEPEILIVDEVLAVGDIQFQKKCLGKMEEVAGEGRTVLFVSHNMGAVSSLCDRAVYLKNGQIKIMGGSEDVVKMYFSDVLRNNVEDLNQLRPSGYGGKIRFTDIQLITQSGSLYFGDPIEYKLKILSDQDMNCLSIGSSFYNGGGNCVGSLLSPEFSVEKNRPLEMRLTVSSGNLAPDSYHAGFSIGFGHEEGTRKDLDVVVGKPVFEILPISNEIPFIANWHPNWGNIVFTDVKLEISSRQSTCV